jgi:membrane-associated phospholipid phosphatase
VNRFRVFVKIWLLSFAACAVLTALSFAQIDVPIARHFWNVGRFLRPLNTAFGATVILSLEAALALGMVLARLVRGHISRFEGALAIACLASICTYGISDEVLKPYFGVPVPAEVMEGAVHGFNFLSRPGNYSFPSGHMALAASFAGVFMTLYRVTLWPLSTLLVLAAVLLVVGDWHFVSDVIAGTFVGVSAGILAGGAWRLHCEQAS